MSSSASPSTTTQPESPPSGGGFDVPTYRHEALSSGPFDDEPMEMWRLVEHRADGSERSGEEIVACSTGWMVAALEAAGVKLGEFDHVVAAMVAEEGWSLVQVVAGWVARASGGVE